MPRRATEPSRDEATRPSQITAASVAGLEQAGFIPASCRITRPGNGRRGGHSDRRVSSYFNYFSSRSNICNDPPPTYAQAAYAARFPPAPRPLDNGLETLPGYSCSVFKEGPMQMKIEACSPFMILPFQEWRPVYVIMQGTQICIYKLKTVAVGKSHASFPGKLLRRYTLQHAEVGMASDAEHTIVTPNTRLAALIPPMARKKAHARDPHLFTIEKQHSLRLRSELDQFCLSHGEEEQMMSWVNHICAGIDIAPAIDDRALPRQTTMPRRRRRTPRDATGVNLTDANFIEQQRRMLAMYPTLGEGSTPRAAADPPQPELVRSRSIVSQITTANGIALAVPDQDNEDIDLSAIAEEGPEGTEGTEQANRSNSQAIQMTHSLDNFDENGKWAPPHPRTAAQQWRYIKRCMPVLLVETPRHSSILIHEGRYVRPHYRMDMLEEWALQPPVYDMHSFPENASPTTTMISNETDQEGDSGSSHTNKTARYLLSQNGRMDSSLDGSDVMAITSLPGESFNILKALGLSKELSRTETSPDDESTVTAPMNHAVTAVSNDTRIPRIVLTC